MNTQLLAYIEQAIDKALDDHCEENLWDGWIHPALSHQMAEAAASVFDAAMDAQEFVEKNE